MAGELSAHGHLPLFFSDGLANDRQGSLLVVDSPILQNPPRRTAGAKRAKFCPGKSTSDTKRAEWR
jgi:hypothetical protein